MFHQGLALQPSRAILPPRQKERWRSTPRQALLQGGARVSGWGRALGAPSDPGLAGFLAALTKHHPPGGLGLKFILSQFWRLAIQNQGISRPQLCLQRPSGSIFLASSQLLVGARNLWHSLACRWITPSSASVVICGSSCVSGSLFSLLLQNDLILANYVYKGPTSQ